MPVTRRSFRLDVECPDDVAPFLRFVGDELAKVGGDSASASPPRSASRAFSLGSARPALISLLSFSTISYGVAFGVQTPYQVLAS